MTTIAFEAAAPSESGIAVARESVRHLAPRLAEAEGVTQLRVDYPGGVSEVVTIRALSRDRPDLSAEQLHRVRAAMDSHVEDAIVTGYEPLIGRSPCPIRTIGTCSQRQSSPAPV